MNKDEEKYVLDGGILTISPVNYSLGIFLYERLLENVHKGTLFLNEVTGEEITYENFLQYSCRLADSIKKYGIVSGSIIAICCEKCIEYFIPAVAGLFAGIPICLINPLFTESELTKAFDLVQPSIVFCSVKNVEMMMKLKKKIPGIKELIVNNSDKPVADAWSLKLFMDKHSDYVDIHNYKPVAVDVENHIAFITFSSGTTGLPKGVMLTHKNLNYNNATYMEPCLTLKNQSQHVLDFLPCFHVFGLHVVMNAIILGRTAIILEGFDFALHLHCIVKYKITTLYLPPPVLQMYTKSSLMDQYDLSHVKYVLTGGAPINESVHRTIMQRVGIKCISPAYGMTETTGVVTLMPVAMDRPGSCGRVVPNIKATVRDFKNGRNLGPLENGELCFKGDMIMKGYYKNEVATKEMFTEDGYLKTGDIGYYDEEGLFYIVDRLKELIKYKSHQVAPAELEAVLMTNPKIRKAAVVGVPDEDAGELPRAFVVKQPDAHLTEQEVIDHVKKLVAPTKYLRGGVVFVEDISTNPSGKILRKEVRQWV